MNALTSTPWTRAPRLLLRRPVVFVSILLASAVLAIAASSGVLFLSTIGTASLRTEAAADCPELSLPAFTAQTQPAELAAADTAGRSALQSATGDPTYSATTATAQVQATRVNLFARTGALDHVQTLTPRTGAAGAWLPDDFAAKIAAHPGDVITTAAGASIRVAGLYRSLAPSPFALSQLPRYFCTWHDLIVGSLVENPTGPLLISDPATLAVAAQARTTITFYANASPSLPLARAAEGPAQASTAAKAFHVQTHLVATVTPDLAAKVSAARLAQRGLGGSVVPIELAGVLVAALLVAGAGAFWATARAREIRFLLARGVGPGALAAKAVLETGPAAAIGWAAGFFAAIALVKSVGPTSILAPDAPLRALGVSAAAVIAALLIIAAIGASAGRERRSASRYSWIRRVPWELGLLGLGAVAGLRVRAHSGVQISHAVIRVVPSTFVFPLLAASAAVLFTARLIGYGLPGLGRAQPLGNGTYLALRRLAGSRAVVLGLVVGTALPCALLTYADAVTHGISANVTAKAHSNLGAPHVLEVIGNPTGTPKLDGHGTAVSVIQSETALADGTEVRLLGVDPGTFDDFAYVNRSQRTAVRKVTYDGGVNVPAILVNAGPHVDASSVTVLTTQLSLEVVSQMPVFPGLRDSFEPMLVIDRSAFGLLDPSADRINQVWTSTSQYDAMAGALRADHYSILTELSPQVLFGNTGLLPVTWIFGYLRALAVLIGLVALAGLVFALAARSRRRAVSYVLSRQMGMSRLTHLRSLVVELALAVGAGWLLGVVVGAAADGLVYRSLDVFAALPPAPSFSWPVHVIAVMAFIVVLVVLLSALVTQLASERTRPADVLRLE